MARMSGFPASALLVVGLAAGLASTSGSAQDTDTPTVKVGDPAPDFELKDAHGASYRLSELVKRGPVVLEFFRSGGW
jgi:cytochrome oxidase Cu insertion factor (SCO1/SenC/PrrC family)